ncbi:MAG: hypothetical protein IKB61_01825 [Elusimicrobiaceae bacterium]|nr:hypothetical protein [Elusimicrobiaceae bacterium]
MKDFREFEKEQLQKAAQGETPERETKPRQAAEITPEEIEKAWQNVRETSRRLLEPMNPETNENDTANFARSTLYPDYVRAAAGAAETKSAAQEAQEALEVWQEIRQRFFKSEQFKKLDAAFPSASEAQYDLLLTVAPAFLWQVAEMLPEILQEIKAHEKATGSKLTFSDLLGQAGELEDATDPREMLLSVLLTRADKRKTTSETQATGELAKYHVAPNTALTNAIRGGIIGTGPQEITIRNATKRKNALSVYGQLYFTFDEAGQIVDPAEAQDDNAYMIATGAKGNLTIRGQHTAFDDAIREAVYSKIAAAKRAGRDFRQLAFTPASLYKEMNHTDKEPSAQAKGAITKSIEKQRRLFADLDLSEDFAMRGIAFINPNTGRPEKRVTYNGLIFKLDRFDIGEGKDKYSIYKMADYPIELAYAEQTGQLITYRADLLDVKEVIDGKITLNSLDITEARQALRNYLYRIIYNMKYQLNTARESWNKYESRRRREITTDKKAQPIKEVKDFLPAAYREQFRILFETMFAECGLNTYSQNDRKTPQRQRDYCFQVLDFLKARGEIKGYSKVTKGRTVRGVDIDL